MQTKRDRGGGGWWVEGQGGSPDEVDARRKKNLVDESVTNKKAKERRNKRTPKVLNQTCPPVSAKIYSIL